MSYSVFGSPVIGCFTDRRKKLVNLSTDALRAYRSTRAPPPALIFVTSLSEALVVSPGVVIASAPCPQP
jgi:hypothetical protein